MEVIKDKGRIAITGLKHNFILNMDLDKARHLKERLELVLND